MDKIAHLTFSNGVQNQSGQIWGQKFTKIEVWTTLNHHFSLKSKIWLFKNGQNAIFKLGSKSKITSKLNWQPSKL